MYTSEHPWLKDLQTAQYTIRSCYRVLDDITSKLQYFTGKESNAVVDLRDIEDILRECEKLIASGITKKVNGDLRESQETTRELFSAMLDMATPKC